MHHHGTVLCQEYQATAPGQMKPYMDALLKSMAARPVFSVRWMSFTESWLFQRWLMMVKGDFVIVMMDDYQWLLRVMIINVYQCLLMIIDDDGY